MDTELASWAPALEALIASRRVSIVNRIKVLAQTASTQDVARHASLQHPGVLVVAGRQTAGRGRLGRAWADTSSMGVAATFAIEASSIDDARLATAAGVAALWACEAVGERGMLGMRWPNDLVERRNLKRKVAGVLIERVGTTALVGMGINVTQHEHDWPEELRGSAVSLAQLGIVTSRITVIEALVIAMDRALTTPVSELIATWKDVETLIGTQQEFLSDGRAYRGTVLDIEPMHTIRVRLSDASIHSLPALSTSMVHPVPGPEGR